ncbi:MAG: hypothetical protein JSS02_14305 [Planctomycetes bacterium]|nr:hypothetical protein [Planctomycetota bacterium]
MRTLTLGELPRLPGGVFRMFNSCHAAGLAGFVHQVGGGQWRVEVFGAADVGVQLLGWADISGTDVGAGREGQIGLMAWVAGFEDRLWQHVPILPGDRDGAQFLVPSDAC